MVHPPPITTILHRLTRRFFQCFPRHLLSHQEAGPGDGIRGHSGREATPSLGEQRARSLSHVNRANISVEVVIVGTSCARLEISYLFSNTLAKIIIYCFSETTSSRRLCQS